MRFLTSCLLAISLAGCGDHLRIGTVRGPETELMKLVKTVAMQDHGIRIKIIEFEDYTLLNTALNDAGLDANIFQHRAFLEEELKNTGYRLIPIGTTFAYPMAIYSHRFTHLRDIKKNAVVGIPYDASNAARALRLLEKAGLIKLDIDAGPLVTLKSIRYNPKELRFKTLHAHRLTHHLQKDVDVAVLNANYAALEGLYAKEHALFTESNPKPYINLMVVRAGDKNQALLKKVVATYQDESILAYARTLFKNQVFTAHGGEGGIRTRGRL